MDYLDEYTDWNKTRAEWELMDRAYAENDRITAKVQANPLAAAYYAQNKFREAYHVVGEYRG